MATKQELRLTSVWCIPAERSRHVLVLARYSGHAQRWAHLLRWTPGEVLAAGAWSTLRLDHRRCQTDPTGEFLMYDAKRMNCGPWDTPNPKLFSAPHCGGLAVSRSPWLSALTHIRGQGITGRGGGASVHALDASDQEKLWEKFPPQREPMTWFARQQTGWQRLPEDKKPRIKTWDGRNADAWVARQGIHAKCGQLLVRLRDKGFVPSIADEVRFAWRSGDGEVFVMDGIAWARIAANGQLLTLSDAGILRAYEEDGKVKGDMSRWACGWRVVEEHDISTRIASPGPSPDWARAPLTAGK